MKTTTFLLAVLFALFTSALIYSQDLQVPQGYQLVWSDEFNETIGPDWVYDVGYGNKGWGNNELQQYTKQNTYVEDGVLIIEARAEKGFRRYSSSRIKTKGQKSFQYGIIAARVKLPYGQGIWPAFWMMGDDGDWPECGEIDIIEMIGGGENRDDTVYGTIHWGDGGHLYEGTATGGRKGYELPDPQWFYEDYHIIYIEWTPREIAWFVDGVETYRTDITRKGMTEFHQSFYLLLNLAVGGNWPGNPNRKTVFPQKYMIDWVRVYQKP